MRQLAIDLQQDLSEELLLLFEDADADLCFLLL